ncbi:methyl-accepting chemotaxis protein [Desulfogranum japonicum]|uniref:methyl-accepting chemotaxis protein n=1 Tax=Desulfogranum japonicum TaxID=231447 RepID=UPI00040FDEC4|nr:methyl-accepting chemotaxis protein [Desulfogranum japonicum]
MSQNDQEKTTLAIIGGGRGGLEILKLLSGSDQVKIAFMVDQDLKAVGMVEAKARGIATKTDLVAALRHNQPDFIFEATGSEKVHQIIQEHLHPGTELISSKASLMLFNVLAENRKKANQAVFTEISTLSEEISQNANSVKNTLTDITNVASSLKVLSINAAIEAARAGDFGRSFSVVASAVKDTANEAQSMVDRIETVNNNNVQMSVKLEELLTRLQ